MTARWAVAIAGQVAGMCGGSFIATWIFGPFGPSQKDVEEKGNLKLNKEINDKSSGFKIPTEPFE
ncbi:hypothetical protein [Algoriphagus sp.]|uniref:hypothetical protein n=1 Tax=Algoriphagus sp. TaxID=1872435 RepID=UPI0025D67D51|nr:hypothetical protein [Algoriphagus sp.]